ncbi:MAG: MmcQ/YjbR family DNA-binding protein [Chloroflexota bacterium]
MTIEDLRAQCLCMTGVYEDFPFGEEVAVFKVKNKMFAYVPLDNDPPTITMKCDPVEAVQLRKQYASVQPGYHMNKKHWNTITVDGELDEVHIRELIEDAYILVRKKLRKSDRLELEELDNTPD